MASGAVAMTRLIVAIFSISLIIAPHSYASDCLRWLYDAYNFEGSDEVVGNGLLRQRYLFRPSNLVKVNPPMAADWSARIYRSDHYEIVPHQPVLTDSELNDLFLAIRAFPDWGYAGVKIKRHGHAAWYAVEAPERLLPKVILDLIHTRLTQIELFFPYRFEVDEVDLRATDSEKPDLTTDMLFHLDSDFPGHYWGEALQGPGTIGLGSQRQFFQVPQGAALIFKASSFDRPETNLMAGFFHAAPFYAGRRIYLRLHIRNFN